MKTSAKPRKALQDNWIGYIVAVGAVALATWLKELAQPNIIPADVPILYIIAIVPVAIFFGLGPAIFTSILSAVAFDFFFISQTNQLTWSVSEAPILIIFLLVGIIISLLESNLKKKRDGANREITIRRQAEKRIVHLGNVLRALRNVNQLITHEKDRESLIQKTCSLLVERRSYEKSWILLLDEKENPVSVAHAGLGEDTAGFLEEIKSGNYPHCVKELLAQKEPLLVLDQPGKRHGECIQAAAHSSGGVFRCKLEHEGKLYGVLGVTVSVTAIADNEEQNLFHELCSDIAFALANIEREEERERAEEQTRELEEYLQLQVDRMPIGLVVWDKDFRVQSWNPSAEKMFGFTAEEALGKHPYDIIVPKEAQPQVDSIWGRLLKGDETAHSTNENTTKDGHTILCAWTNTPLREADGDVLGVLSMVQDITEQKQAEDRLKSSEERFRMIFEYAPDAYYLNDLEGNFIDGNRAAERISGYQRSELIGKSLLKLNMLAPQDIPRAAEALVKNTLGHPTGPDEFSLIRNDGSQVTVEISTFPIEIAGKPLVLSIARDITERKRAEEEKEKLQAQLAQAQKMESVGRLAGGVAHDFNNMLAVIIGYAQLSLQKIDSASPLYADLQEILKAGQRSADLTRQLLAFARKQTVYPQVIDLNDTIPGMSQMLQRLIGEDINLIWKPGKELWKVKIDPTQLNQILANLVINARDAIHGTGSIILETQNVVLEDAYCAVHADCISGDYVLLGISDTGIGMSKEILSHIFEPFFTTKELGQGTGLGLATVYGIVKQNGGNIGVYSEPQKGTTFKVYLPRFRGEAEVMPEQTPDKKLEKGTETVLIAEDEQAILTLSQKALESLGYTVLAANTPKQAISLAQAYDKEIHLLITDVVMPEMNGKDLAQELRRTRPGLRSLYMSGYTSNIIAHRGVLDEGVRFLRKPFSVQELADKVREALSNPPA